MSIPLKRGEFYGEPQAVTFTTRGGIRNREGVLVEYGEEYCRVRLEDGNFVSPLTRNIRALPESEDEAQTNVVQNDEPSLAIPSPGTWVHAWTVFNSAFIDIYGQVTVDEYDNPYLEGFGTIERLGTKAIPRWTIVRIPEATARAIIAERTR